MRLSGEGAGARGGAQTLPLEDAQQGGKRSGKMLGRPGGGPMACGEERAEVGAAEAWAERRKDRAIAHLQGHEARTSAPSTVWGKLPPGPPVLGVWPTCQIEEPPSRVGTQQASPPEASRWLLRAMFRWHMAKRSAPTSGETEGSHEVPALHLHAPACRTPAHGPAAETCRMETNVPPLCFMPK